MKDNPTVTVLILVEVGSKYETKESKGISHFLEHLCFKGTEKRKKAMDILKELDSLGSAYNAFTSHEYTGYYAKADDRHFAKIFDVVSDIYLHSTLPEKEIEKEKGVIIEEINMYQDMPHRNVQDLFTTLLYGDQPAGWNILGEKKTVSKMTQAQLLKYKETHYVPKATVIAIAGKITEKEVLAEVKKSFGAVKNFPKGKKLKVFENQKTPRVLLEYKKTDQAHFVLGTRTYPLADSRNQALSILASVLAGGMSARLYERLREEMGVGYYLNASNQTFSDHGFFQISAGVDKKRIKEVLEVVLQECQKIAEAGISKEELKRAKEILVSGMKFSLESTEDIASFYGGQEILRKKIEPAEEKIKKLRLVSEKDVQKIAQEIFKKETLNLALIGPFKEEKEFLKILKFC